MSPKNKVIFYQIHNTKIKLIKIIQNAMYHFERKEKLLIQVQDDLSLKFTDELLWKLPKESFLPHIVSEEQCDDFIVITKSAQNINNANYLFNLCQDLVNINQSFKIIYDFDDYTSNHKQYKSQKRFEIYKNANFLIESS